MTVSELIEHLEKLPKDKMITIFWDGDARGIVEGIINDDNEVVIVGDWNSYDRKQYSDDKIVYG